MRHEKELKLKKNIIPIQVQTPPICQDVWDSQLSLSMAQDHMQDSSIIYIKTAMTIFVKMGMAHSWLQASPGEYYLS